MSTPFYAETKEERDRIEAKNDASMLELLHQQSLNSDPVVAMKARFLKAILPAYLDWQRKERDLHGTDPRNIMLATFTGFSGAFILALKQAPVRAELNEEEVLLEGVEHFKEILDGDASIAFRFAKGSGGRREAGH